MTNKTAGGEPTWPDPIITAMFTRLPPYGSEWPIDQRVLWLQAMEGVLHMVYGRVETIDISGLLPVQRKAAEKLISGVADENQRCAAATSSDESTDKALAEAAGAASGSGNASTTEAPNADRMGGAWSNSSEADSNETASEVDPPRKNVGGAPSKAGRPAGIPTNLEIAIECIKEVGPASAPQIRTWARKRYWQGMPESWTAVLYDFVKNGKLARSGLNFVLPGEKERPKAIATQAPKAPPPPVKPAAQIIHRPLAAFKFDHNGKSTELDSSRLYVLASKLKAAMGKGHVSEAFLAESVIGSNTERHRDEVKNACLGMNDKLADVGLQIGYYPGFGLLMKEIGA